MRPLLALLLLTPALVGCLGASDDVLDPSATDAIGDVPTLPEGLEMEGAEVVADDGGSITFLWNDTVAPGSASVIGPSAPRPSTPTTTMLKLPTPEVALRLRANLTWQAERALELQLYAANGTLLCDRFGTSEPLRCHHPWLPADGGERTWTVQVGALTDEAEPIAPIPFEVEVTVQSLGEPDPPTPALGCDAPLWDERVRIREIDAATDPSDPDRIAVAMIATPPTFRDDPPRDWQIWDALAVSEDGGTTWDFALLPGWPGDTTPAPTAFHGAPYLSDPIVEFLPDGTILYAGLVGASPGSNNQVFTARFPPGELAPEFVAVLARGSLTSEVGLHEVLTPTKPMAWNDKEQLAIDPFTGDAYVAWTWRGDRPDAHATVVLSRSEDGGRTWSAPQQLADDGHPSDVQSQRFLGFPTPFVTQDGTVHVVWLDYRTGEFYQVSSKDRGATFSEPRLIADMETSFLAGRGGAFMNPQPNVAVDRTGGPRDGTVYVAFQARDAGDEDVWVVTSEDHGETWTSPVRVNGDEAGWGNHQFQPAVTVGPDGETFVLYMDRRDDPSHVEYRAYLARSGDGGQTWTSGPLSSEATDPWLVDNGLAGQSQYPYPGRTRVGDYNGLTWTENGLLAVWQDGREGTEEVSYSTAWMCLLETRGEAS